MSPKKIQSPSGRSLASIYDVRGSISGLDLLSNEEVQAVHELGATIFSERVGQGVRRRALNAGAIAQNVTFDETMDDLPFNPFRVAGVGCITDTLNGIAHITVSARSPRDDREYPLFNWDSTLDSQPLMRIRDNGAAAANFRWLRSIAGFEPLIMVGGDKAQFPVGDIAIRGLTGAFGPGNANIVVLLLLTFTTQGGDTGGLGSFGLPLPSW